MVTVAVECDLDISKPGFGVFERMLRWPDALCDELDLDSMQALAKALALPAVSTDGLTVAIRSLVRSNTSNMFLYRPFCRCAFSSLLMRMPEPSGRFGSLYLYGLTFQISCSGTAINGLFDAILLLSCAQLRKYLSSVSVRTRKRDTKSV